VTQQLEQRQGGADVRISTTWACLVAVLISVVAAAGAAAEPPDYGRCLKVKPAKSGVYGNSGCTTIGGLKANEYEWHPWGSGAPTVEKRGFTTKLKPTTTATLETVGGYKVVCTGETGSGKTAYNSYAYQEIESLKLEGCSSVQQPCTTSGAKEGIIVTTRLRNLVGWIDHPLKKVGALLYFENEFGPGMEFDCAGGPLAHVKINRGIISPLKSGKMLLKENVKYVAKGGYQKPGMMESFAEPFFLEVSIFNGAEEFVEWQVAGLTMTIEQTNEEKWEINPIV
jgi:hypothetical protein